MQRGELDLDHTPSTAADEVETGVDEESVEPAIERADIATRRQVAPAPDERVLDRVPREVGVPDDQAGCRIQPRDGHAGERREGVMIASLRLLDESSLVHDAPLRGATQVAALAC